MGIHKWTNFIRDLNDSAARAVAGSVNEVVTDPDSPEVLNWRFVDMTGSSSADVEDLVTNIFSTPVDPQMASVEFTLVQVGKTSHILVLNLCHIVWDGASIEPIQRQLSETYAALRNGIDPPTLNLLDSESKAKAMAQYT